MIREIRKKFIFTAMLVFVLVMAILGLSINIINFRISMTRVDRALSFIMDYEKNHFQEDPKGALIPWQDFPESDDPEFDHTTRFFGLYMTNDGEVTNTFMDYIASIDQETAKQYAETVLAKNKTQGFYKKYRYMVDRDDNGTYVLFLSTASEMHNMKVLTAATLGTCAFGFILGLIFVILFSKRAVKPFADNIEKQQRFITDASHELKTPVTAITASTEVLEMEYGQDEWLENIQKQTGNLSKLISQMVLLSRLDEKIGVPDQCLFSLSDVAWEMTESFTYKAKAAGKSFQQEIEENVTMCGQEELIRQLFSVLLENAVKYSSAEGNIHLKVAENKGKISIALSNSIEGQPLKDANRLFDRFYRPDQSRNAETGGNGIGLSIARAITEAHGGKISVSYPDRQTIQFKAVFRKV